MTKDCPECGQATPTTYTDLIAIIDKSGSMGSLANDTIGGFNGFLKEQREEEGLMKLTLVQFDDKYEICYEGIDVCETEDLTDKTYKVCGMTALNDALGRSITTARDRINKLAVGERPNRVMFVVITDGEENSSKEFTLDQVRELVKGQQDGEKWDFLFLGADIDSFSEGGNLGVAAGTTLNYAKSAMGMSKAYETLGKSVTRVRGCGSAAFTDEERKENQDEIDKLD